MPIYVVGARNQRVHIPHQPISVSITGAVSGVELEIRCAAEQPVIRNSAHHAVLPRLISGLSVAVRPVGAPRFAPGTAIHLTIAPDNPAEVDPVQVVFDPVDVSGDASVVFATLTPRGQQIEVGVSAVADRPLGPLAAAARSAARNAIGRGQAASSGKGLVLAMDASASMRTWFTDGTVAAVADIVVGVADAVGAGEVSAVYVGADVAGVPPVPGAELSAAVRAAQPRWCAGARWSRLSPGPARTVVCTDFATEAVRQSFPTITLSNDHRQDAAGGPRLPSPPPGHDAAAAMLANPGVIERVVVPLALALQARPM
ncbi:hypothetical protein [Mycobacterium sp. ACS4331]|uniref:hypothetical protein n=1 Tax=Mycobacterium sp. ACS4331 TaxID=1834121 RepID=UPI000801ADD1|nr:hypothetical protein [Mycobacterium sp. ACS4331]OBF27649.1 hypothetical protein A5727_25975 [Mycobacterium sp. ACS4331]